MGKTKICKSNERITKKKPVNLLVLHESFISVRPETPGIRVDNIGKQNLACARTHTELDLHVDQRTLYNEKKLNQTLNILFEFNLKDRIINIMVLILDFDVFAFHEEGHGGVAEQSVVGF